jgi:hypothetical protein
MKHITQIGILSMLLVASGCSTTSYSPSRGEVVGGGVSIYWEAPSDGTAILVEKNTGTIIKTESLNEGDKFEFDAADEWTQDQLRLALTVAQEGADFVLYFRASDNAE